ncbi:hypothetical protein [Sphingomonas jaspsi]|uniref:hypothetical protein n=1 Tax=Sphingomonas jaspsi TaxID=392409 RepID=UPI0004AD1D5D|nr:hypothetical protein [Sphingomonas jaspsi]
MNAPVTIPLSAGIRLFSGVMFDYDNPHLSDVAVQDIAEGLGKICRFAGQCRHFYSVAQHAVNASYIVAEGFEFDALMHDTAEAFTNDIPRPMKSKIPGFKELETRIEGAMSRLFNFSYPLPPEVRLVDDQMLKLEKEELLPNDHSNWAILDYVGDVSHLKPRVDLTPWPADLATYRFLERYEELSR